MSDCVIDLNVDLGEGGGDDAELIAMASSANIACGGHSGDLGSMRAAIDACMSRGVALGAHPGYEDREHFGRRPLDLPVDQLRCALRRQLERFAACAEMAGAAVHHVKLHGALYHQVNQDPALAEVTARVVAGIFPGCFIYTTAPGCMADAAAGIGLQVVAEAFADRCYGASGALVPRGEPGAVICDSASVVAQALEIACHQRVRLRNGAWLPLRARTLCIHGDTRQAGQLMRDIATAMACHGIKLVAP